MGSGSQREIWGDYWGFVVVLGLGFCFSPNSGAHLSEDLVGSQYFQGPNLGLAKVYKSEKYNPF